MEKEVFDNIAWNKRLKVYCDGEAHKLIGVYFDTREVQVEKWNKEFRYFSYVGRKSYLEISLTK